MRKYQDNFDRESPSKVHDKADELSKSTDCVKFSIYEILRDASIAI